MTEDRQSNTLTPVSYTHLDVYKRQPLEQVSMLLGHKSVKITEKHYAPWVKARQEQLAVNVRKSWTVLAAGNQTGKRKSPKRAKSA